MLWQNKLHAAFFPLAVLEDSHIGARWKQSDIYLSTTVWKILLLAHGKWASERVDTNLYIKWGVVLEEKCVIGEAYAHVSIVSHEILHSILLVTFYSFTFLSADKQYCITVDGFVYAPQENKRNYLREVEAIVKSVK